MKQSSIFPKTKKETPKDAISINHKYLVRGGFIDQLMAGGWTLLPLGFRVVNKINNIIREEMNNIGGQEVLMPLLHPKAIWNETGRWEKADEIMYKLKDNKGKEYVLSFTHEEVVMDLLRKNIDSYQDLPVHIYHFSTKFRNEPRARSGIIRGREFLMKDLYSAHASEQEMLDYYEKVKKAYGVIFARLGFNYRITEAAGGVFTDRKTHEFQIPAKGGEDTIYYCDYCDWGQNKEIFKGDIKKLCPKCRKGKIIESKSIEVGNIFPLGTYYSERMRVYYTDNDGKKKPVWFASYGIGPTRTMGAWVEVSHDKRGIIWNENISPFDVHLLELKFKNSSVKSKKIYDNLVKAGVDVLWDDRNVGAGEKFTDADLIGIPVRLIISEKTKDKLEWKERVKEKTELIGMDEVLNRLNIMGNTK